jgi:hypothetical protein
MSDRDQEMFSCAAHQFTIVANYDEASTRGSIGQPKAGCPDCILAVNDALEYHKNCVPAEPPVLSREFLDSLIDKRLPLIGPLNPNRYFIEPTRKTMREGAKVLAAAILESLPTQTKALFSGPQPDWAFEYQRLQSALVTFICAATGKTPNEVPLDPAGLSAILESLISAGSEE